MLLGSVAGNERVGRVRNRAAEPHVESGEIGGLMLGRAWMQKTGLKWREASLVLYEPVKRQRFYWQLFNCSWP